MVVSHAHHVRAACPDAHRVQFYDKEEHLHGVLADYFAPFVGSGDGWLGAIVLARKRTTSFLKDYLLNGKFTCNHPVGDYATPLGMAYTNGQRKIFLVDADMVLEKLVVDNELKPEEFDKLVGELMSNLLPELSTYLQHGEKCYKSPIYAYGELVDVLCSRGQHLLAVELEAIWNNYLASRNISLLCGYKMDSFKDARVANAFKQICHSHTTVLPTEKFSNIPNPKQQLAMIAELEQKAAALHSQSSAPPPNAKVEQQMKNREQFVDTLCHELQNPVSGITGNVELLKVGLDVRRAILNSNEVGEGDDSVNISAADIAALRDQLADDSESVAAIASGAEHLKTLSDDVLSLSKLEGGKVHLKKVSFDIRSVTTSVLKTFSTQARKKKIRLIEDLPVENLRVVGDPGRLTQVMLNLISNAVKFTSKGSITVQLRSLGPSMIDSNSISFKVVVRDTGRGLSQDEISTLFRRFSQPLSTSLASDEGAGLGLYISKHVVELMGGTMSVESEKANGSTFSFTFLAQKKLSAEDAHDKKDMKRSYDSTGGTSSLTAPISHRPKITRGRTNDDWHQISRAASENQKRSPSTSSFDSCSETTSTGDSSGLPQWHERHILIVDDNPIIIRIVTRILENATTSSLTLSTAANGYDAISKIISLSTSSTPVDLVLMDLDMPFMDGLKAARKIRNLVSHPNEKPRSVVQELQMKRLANTPIVGLTADIREERFVEAQHNGMDDCIGKPVSKKVLLELMGRVVWQPRGN